MNRTDQAPLPDAWLACDPLPADPVPILKRWLAEAFEAGLQPNPHAMALATVDPDGRPAVRMVLCNEIDAERGALTMYTHLQGRKGRAIAVDPRAAVAFHWGPQDRQARAEGRIELTPAAQCDAYFGSRPLDAKLGAWASAQSEPIESRAALLDKVREVAKRFGALAAAPDDVAMPRPPHWGGYTLVSDSIELWVSRPGRIHDRARWTRSAEREAWRVTRLQP